MFRPALASITDYAVEVRYPGNSATPAESRTVPRTTERIRTLVRQSLGLA